MSCVRDEYPPCAPLTVEIDIEDRNFNNISDVPELEAIKPETPFGKLITHLYIRLEDPATGKAIEDLKIVPSAEGRTCNVAFNDSLPYGKYVVTAWGNTTDGMSFSDGYDQFRFETQNRDIFVCRDTVDYQPAAPIPAIRLKRTVGMLLAEVKGLPTYVKSAKITAYGLREYVDADLKYHGETDWAEQMRIEESGSYENMTLLPILLSPSVSEDATEVISRFYADENLLLAMPDIRVTLKRNSITRLRYEWKNDNIVNVYINVDGKWEQVTTLNVNEQ